MEYQSLLHKKLHAGNFVFTAETTPPDASDKEVLLKKVKPLKDIADAINVTDSPGAKVHMSALTAAIILAQNDIDPILQLTVRDRNRLAIQGDLVGASALGVHNILCLSGDDPKVGDQPETKAAKDIDKKDYFGVTLLKAEMNKDLQTQDLKKKQSTNESFWLMGSPDVECKKQKDGKYIVTVNGFDYYNTKTDEIESGNTSKIVMWELDTDYDDRSLYPQQVFFPMDGKSGGWSKLAKTLQAEIDEDLITKYQGTESIPFEAGPNKRVAIKIIDDRGIESLKIIDLE